MLKFNFASDNASGVHPLVMKSLTEIAHKYHIPYGHHQLKVSKMFSAVFGKSLKAYFVYNGTAANILGLKSGIKSMHGVICNSESHINSDECGAFENISGSKILYAHSKKAKILPRDIRHFLESKGNYHQSQPKIISISQPTEVGTLYSLQEIRDLSDFAHQNEMFLHIDGARLANALVALDCSLSEMIIDTNVDILSFGGTKNGLMFGEAIVFINKFLAKDFDYLRKQNMQLHSKAEFITIQYKTYFEEDLYLKNAKKANQMAK